ncbi:MAG TPA: Calx-beta domain-containing protein [Pirellulales bacterium]|nr:Calx-beta domain-containing protein [Pirellulales bacterium]
MSLASILDRLACQPAIPRRKKLRRPPRFYVEMLERRALLTTYTVTSTVLNFDGGDDQHLGLLIAMERANGHPNDSSGPDVIDFNIPSSGVQTISPTAALALPAITDPVIIDATTQPGYTPQQPLIDLDGTQAAFSDGLLFSVGGNTVKGLIISNFAALGIVLDGSADPNHGHDASVNNVIQANWIGTDASGTTAAANLLGGIKLIQSSHNLIGGVNQDGKLVEGNLISGNGETGIFLEDQSCTANYIEGNYVGTDVTGLLPIKNAPDGEDGIYLGPPTTTPALGFASGNFIGDFDPTNQFELDGRNIIGGNSNNGIYILGGSGNLIAGNYIGLGADGLTPVPNGRDGVRLEDASSNIIGGVQDNAGNTISGNLHNGIEIVADDESEQSIPIPVSQQSAKDNVIQGNHIGTDASATVSTMTPAGGDTVHLGNGQDGVALRNLASDPSVAVSLTVIGGTDSSDGTVDGTVKARNIISGNLDSGILMQGAGVTLNTVEGDYIGTNTTGDKALPNSNAGVSLTSISGDLQGPSANRIGVVGSGNIISGNGTPAQGTTPAEGAGIRIANFSDGNFVVANRIGTTADGLTELPNVDGVDIVDSADNIVGGDVSNDQNVISGNLLDGVSITGGHATGNKLQNNLVGVNLAGTALANTTGVSIEPIFLTSPSGNLIGGTEKNGNQEVGLGNVISHNRQEGVLIGGGSQNNSVAANTIDDNFTGVVILDSPSNTIGGTTPASANSIGGNLSDGIEIEGTNATINLVEGNAIGIDAAGANGSNGVLINNAPGNVIGGAIQGARNVISGNLQDGVRIEGEQAQVNVVAGNYIGVASDGSPAPNGAGADPANPDALTSSGVVITAGASLNTIGGDGDLGRNIISGNASDGVHISSAGSKNVVKNNYIGLNVQGTGPLSDSSKQLTGITVDNTPLTLIGADSFDQGGNVISGSNFDGIFIGGQLSSGTVIKGNYIGTNKDATAAVGNRFGINLAAESETVGASGPSTQTTVTDNIVAGNRKGGISINAGATQNHLTSNQIGTGQFGNAGAAIRISNSPSNFIGEEGAGNTIVLTGLDVDQDPVLGSGFGILVTGSASQANDIADNNIADNANAGIEIFGGASGNRIGNTQGNIVVDNLDGIVITGSGTNNNTVINNDIGIEPDNTPRGNAHNGVLVSGGASNNAIGTLPGSNTISANGLSGVLIQDAQSHGNTVLGNFIGTDVEGNFHKDGHLGNGVAGVYVEDSPDNKVGGETDGAGNVVEGNLVGVALEDANATGNVVEGNEIANNSDIGVRIIRAYRNQIGGPDEADGNEIHDNGSDGVEVDAGTGNSVLHNEIFQNEKLGIELVQGGNNLQAAPWLQLATTGNSHRIAGWITASPNTTFTLEFFTGDNLEHSDNSEDDDAEKFIPVSASQSVTTNSGGVAIFDAALPDDLPDGTVVRATATNPNGDTSQFSNPVFVRPDSDGDGAPDVTENASPLGDSNDASTVSVQDALNQNGYVTLQAPVGINLQSAWSIINPSPSPNDPTGPTHTQFGLGFVDFSLTGVAPGQHVVVTMTLPVTLPHGSTYWRYGKTPNTPSPHWYDWNYDPHTDTGAQIDGNTITLHFVNGGRGDDDLDASNDSIEDAGSPGAPDPFTVTTTADSGLGSLRQAILNANANPGNDEITFDLPGSVPQIIQPLSPLPAITDPVTIDGLKLPASEDGHDIEGTTPLVELDGSLAGPGADGLTFEVGSSIVRGLIIDHFSGDGIRMESNGSIDLEEFLGNTISGMTLDSNGGYGIEVNDTPDNTIGEDDTSGGNVISGNAKGGISIHGSDASQNSLTNNLIGTTADGVTPLPNLGPGVLIGDGASGAGVGSEFDNPNNTIAFNTGPGVEVLPGASAFVQGNSIFANQGLGVDLDGDGVTPNDADDSDGVQNFPVLTSVASYGGYTYINGTLASSPQSGFTLDFYASPAADPSGFGEGQVFVGSKLVFTDASGQGSFALNFQQSVPPGWFITATASSFETSEFSAAVKVPTLTPLVLTVNTPDDVDNATPDPAHFSLREAIEAANAHPGQDVIDFDLPDQTRTISPLSPLPNITDPVIIDGTSQFGYAGLPLVELDGSQAGDGANGLTITGGGSVVRGLVIHSFSGSGIELTGLGGNVVEGNFIGTDVTGTNYLPNQRGDVFVYLSPDNLIGGTTAAARNVIGLIHLDGYNIDTAQPDDNSGGNRVEGNYIGTDMTGTVILPGGALGTGILIDVSAANTIGGTAPGAGNLINGSLEIADSDSNFVQGNLIGTDFTGTVALSGSIDIAGEGLPAEFNQIGGDTPAARNIIVGQFFINGSTGSLNLVQGNYIGTDITGTVALGGKTEHDGITIEGSSNTIGGAEPGQGNLISGNSLPGFGLAGIGLTPSAHDNFVLGNRIGTDVTGTKPLGNDIGIRNQGYNNTFGGSFPGTGNVISGNNLDGINLGPDGGNVVKGNLIGTDYTGTKALGNGDGISGGNTFPNLFSGDLIGGTEPGARNVISGNRGFGISITGRALVQGNYVGVDASGMNRLGNGGMGVGINQNSTLGGPAPGAGNVISANGLDGVDADSAGNVVQGNKIGTDVTGTLNFGNGGDGISIITSYAIASEETIGGTDPGAGNVVAYNGRRGVSDPFGSGNVIRGNDIFANGDIGLVTDINGVMSTYAEQRGVSLPHSAPVLTSAVFDQQGTVVTGTLTGEPLTYYAIDFFANDSVPPSGFGDGQTYLQSISVLMDASGSTDFQITLDQAVPIGKWITATATPDTPDGNTSQFSQATPVVAAVDPSDIEFAAPSFVVSENGGAAVVVVTRTGSTSGTATVVYTTSDGSATAGANYTTTAGTLTFNDGDSSETLTIPIQNDGLADGSKTFQIVLSNPSGADLGSLHNATVTILDDDRAGQIALASSAFTVDQALNGDVFDLTRTGGSQGRVTVDYRVTGGTAIGSVRLPNAGEQLEADYVDAFGTVTFDDGQTTAQINIQRIIDYINGDLGRPEYKGPRTIELTIGNPTGGATLGDITTSTMTIQDEEDRAGAFSIGGQTSALESDGKVFISIERFGNLFSVQTIHYATVDGTAKAGANYTATAGTVTFNAEQSQASFSVPILDDGVVDDPGSFQVVISDPGEGAFIFDGLDRWTVQILDSDTPAPDQVVVSSSRFAEDANSAKILVELLNGRTGTQDEAHGAVTFDYATSDGTAKAGVDYTATSGTLTFFPGEPDLFITVPILPHHDASPDSTFFVTLSNIVGDAVVGGDNPATQTLFQTDSPGPISISAAQYVVAEAKAGLTITIAYTPGPGDYATVWADYSTVDGTAQAGDRYLPVSGTLAFGSSESSDSDPTISDIHTITIPILNNLSVEGNQTFYLKLSNLAGGASLGANSVVPITVLDEDEQSAPVTISAGGPYTITEGDSLTLLATTSGGSSPDLSWDINGDGIFGDAIGANPTLSWAQLQALGISDRPGTYQVSVRATDLVNQVTSDPTPLTVSDVPVVGTGGFTYSAAAGGTPANETLATFTDPPGAETLDNYSADIDWGDGTSSTAGDISFDAQTQVFTVSGEHTYAASGAFPIHVTLHHNSAAGVTVASSAAVGQAIPPSFTRLTSDLSKGSAYGQEVTFTATVSATSGAPTGSVDFVDTTTGEDLGSVQLAVVNGVDEASVGVSNLDARSHTIVATYSSDTNNFVGSHDSLTQSVAPATLTVTADSKSKVYGSANPAFSAIISGFVNGDTTSVVTGTASLSTVATSASGVGSYAITAGAGTLSAANYTFAFVNGMFSVTPATLTVTAENKTMVYGAAVPALTDTISGFVNGDTSSIVTGAASLSTAATSASGVGNAIITAAPGTLSATNYTFAFANGTLSVTPATLTVTADNKSKTTGADNPPLTDTITGFVNNDLASVVTGAADLATAATPGSAVGTYPITVRRGTLNAANYTFTFVDGNLTVTPSGSGTGETGILATGAPIAGYEFSPLSAVSVATFTDGDGSLSAGDFSATINWGDGTTSAGSVSLSSGAYTVTGSHEYVDEGQYTLEVNIAQTAGAATGATSALATAAATIHEQRLANGSVGAPDQNWIQEMYRDLFHRQAELQGLNFWLGLLHGGESREQVAFQIVKVASFEEFQRDTVASLYQQYLGRAPDPAGLDYWAAYLYDGGTIEGMSQALVSSPEYFQTRGGTVDGFLKAAFQDILGRQIDPAALTYFEGLMSQGASAADVGAAIFASDEYHRLRVNSFFEQFLDRSADAHALAYFAGELDDGRTDELVISQILASDEYFAIPQV